jgi:hypothetical protein
MQRCEHGTGQRYRRERSGDKHRSAGQTERWMADERLYPPDRPLD